MTYIKKNDKDKKSKNLSNKTQNILKPKIADDKLKPLMPTLRQKKRFVRIKIEAKQKLDFKEVSDSLTDDIILYLGLIDYGKAGVWILKDKFDFEKQELIIRVSLKLKDKLLGALGLINKIGKENVKLNIIRVSGTIKGAFKENSR